VPPVGNLLSLAYLRATQ